ncbi:MAG: TonB-dependent receptor [Acidaminococcaceae bacterium]
MKKVSGKTSFGVLISFLVTGSLLTSDLALAAENKVMSQFTLDEMVVTATRTMKNIKEIPASVDVITANDIAAKNVTSITEALQTVTGVYKNPIAQGDIAIRGFSSKDILVLLDGQPMNSGWNGTMNWEMIPVESIERIEIVKGAGSSLYGGKAVGAVVSIITKENSKKLNVAAALSYGSNNTWKKSLYVNSKVNKKLSVGAGYEKKSSDGYKGFYRSINGKNKGSASGNANLTKLGDGSYIVGGRGEKKWDNDNYSLNLKYDFDANKALKYTYMRSNNTYSYKNPFSYIYDQNGNQVFTGTFLTQDGQYIKIKPSNFLGYVGKRETDLHTLNYHDDENKIMLNIGFGNTKKDGYSSPSSTADSVNWAGKGTNSFYPSKAYNLDFQKAWENIGKHTLVVGFNGKLESFEQTRYNLDNWKEHNTITSSYPAFEQHGGKGRSLALFVQDDYKMSDKLTMYTGIRFDNYKKYDGYSYYLNANGSHKTTSRNHGEGSYNALSPKLAFEYKTNKDTSYYASYGHSFNPPILYQVYRDGGGEMGKVRANPDLNPETSNTIEIGLKKSLGIKTKLGIAIYQAKTKDKVEYITHYQPGGKDAEFKRYENAGTEDKKGVEFDLKHQFDKTWGVYGNYAWQRGEITNSKNATYTNYDIPKHLLHAGVNYTKDKWNIALDAQYVSERQAADSVTGEYGAEDAFFIMNTYCNYKLTKEATLQFSIQNLFNKEFYASEATSGRTYTVGLRYAL